MTIFIEMGPLGMARRQLRAGVVLDMAVRAVRMGRSDIGAVGRNRVKVTEIPNFFGSFGCNGESVLGHGRPSGSNHILTIF